MLQLRPYQREAIDSLYAYWQDEASGNALIVLPTGAGKALVIAKIIEELLAGYPDMRILNVTHSANLVAQNYKEFIGLMPFAPAGIYSASLNRRDARAQVLFCGIQSIAKKAHQIGNVDLVIIDEAHAISRDSNTLYGKFFADLAKTNEYRRVGLTATDYRMDSGRLTDGPDQEIIETEDGDEVGRKVRLFDDVVYEAKIGDLIEQGYLTKLTSQKTLAKINLKGIGSRGGDYIPGQLQDAAERIIDEAIAEDMVASEGRRAGMFFCAGKENAIHVRDAIRRHGRTCEALTSDNSHEAEGIFRRFWSGELWSIASVNMLYTGSNFPFVDFISLLFSTKSAGKLVQALGRGTRNSPGKDDCLIADHGRNLAYHGPIDQISPREPGKGEGDQPQKQCPQDGTDIEGKTGCGEMIPISRMVCHCCGYIFPPSEEEKITAQADSAPVLSTEKPWSVVNGRTFRRHEKPEKTPSVKVTYMIGMRAVNEWVCAEHTGFPKSKADRYWSRHGGQRPFPSTVDEFLDRAGELATTAEVQLDYSRNPKYPDVKDYRVGAANDNYNEPEADNDNIPQGHTKESWSAILDDEIPF